MGINWDEWFVYDETSLSCLRWKTDRYSGGVCGVSGRKLASKGDIVGNYRSDGYYAGRLHNKSFLCHRVIWEMFNNYILPNYQVDHIDGIRANNKINNLRLVSNQLNSRNRKMSSNNTSGRNGVGIKWNGSSWYCVARWNDANLQEVSKAFSIDKLGIMIAFRDACAYRDKMIQELNKQGTGYTERHCK